MWLPRGKIGFSEVARRSGAFSVSRPLNALTGHQSTARTSAGSLRGYRRIGRSLLEYVPDTRREHGDGRFHRGGGRRAVSGARRDFPTTEETCRRPRACPNRSALRIRDGYRTARVDVDTRALLRERHARPIRPTRRRIGHGRAARRAFSVRVGDFVACCSRAFTVEAAENCAVPDASRGDGPDRLSRRTMVRGVSREPWDPPHRPRVRLTSVPFHRRRIFHSGHRVPRRGSSQHDARAFHLPDSRRETSLARRPRVKLTARTVRYHRRKTFDDKLNAIGVILTVRRPGPHPTRPSSTKFTSPAETHTTRKTKLSPHIPTTLHIPTQTLALALTSALVTAWSLRAYPTAIGLGHASVIVNLLLLTETAVRSAVKPSVSFATSSRDRQDRYTNPRDAPAFLVLDTVSLALVTLHSLQVCGFVHFADPRVALALVAAWPATIANWITRLALETTAFDSLARAVAVKEVAAMRLATQVRRLGGVRSVPPDANAFKRFLHWCACMWDSGKLMAESGSGRTFRRAMLACSCVDWVLLLGAWTAMGIQGAATHGGTWVDPGGRRGGSVGDVSCARRDSPIVPARAFQVAPKASEPAAGWDLTRVQYPLVHSATRGDDHRADAVGVLSPTSRVSYP